MDNPQDAAKMAQKAKTDNTILSDPDGIFLDTFGLRHEKAGPGGKDIARAATVLLNQKGDVLWTKVAESYRVRPDHEKTLQEVSEVLSQ